MGAAARRCGARARRTGGRAARGSRARTRCPGVELARGATARGRAARGGAGSRARAPLDAARVGRDLRAAWPGLDARHVRRAGSGRRRRPHLRRYTACVVGARRRRSPPPRHGPGLGARRPAGHRRVRVRHRLHPPRGQDRGTRRPLRERSEARRLARGAHRPAGRAVGSSRPSRQGGRPPARGARGRGAGRARARRDLPHRRGERRPGGCARRGRAHRAGTSRAPRRGRVARAADPQRRRRLRRRLVAGADRRSRHRREPRASDGRLGTRGGRARPRGVSQARDGAAADAGGAGARAPDRGGARRRRGPAQARRGGAAVRALAPDYRAYEWAPSTEDLAQRAGLDPMQIVRFDANVPPLPPPTARPGAVAGAVARVNEYPRGGYPELCAAIASYVGLERENVVLGAGADDLLLLTAAAFAGAGDTVAVPAAPTYPLYRIAAQLAGAEVGDDEPVLTYCCRPNNPTGALEPLPAARPLVVDEAYIEFAEDGGAAGLLDDGVVVVRTFSKSFGLAGARVGYALAATDVAAELNARQNPAPGAPPSVALALAALAEPPDVGPVVAERERLASELRGLGYSALPSRASFLYVPLDEPDAVAERLLAAGCVVRIYPDAIRISVRDREDDDLLLAALAGEPPPAARRARHVRATAETSLRVRLGLDGASRVRVATGAGLYDHLLEQLAFHAGLDLVLEGSGDGETGPHHTAEDSAIALGEALDLALADRRGIARYGDAVVPMDDALARAAVDLGGRRAAVVRLEHDPGLAAHVLGSLADRGRLALHVEATGTDPHHVAEAAFKATGRALRSALRLESGVLPSTKGVL